MAEYNMHDKEVKNAFNFLNYLNLWPAKGITLVELVDRFL